MDRLTMWYDGNHAICENEECTSGDCPFADPICEQVQNIIDRLAAYEETGLEPERIELLIPADDVAEVRHGRWVNTNKEVEQICKCSECGYPISYFWSRTPYCPNCGALMKEDEHEAD